MNTPAHLIFGAAALTRRNAPYRNAAVLFGAILPDLSLYFMVFWNANVRGMSDSEIFGREYFSDYWQRVFSIDNSLPLWTLVLVVGVWRRWPIMVAFAAAGLLHILLDFPLHHDDGRAHFWPFTDWIFRSPVSYWDPNHHGALVGGIELALCVAFALLLWRRFTGLISRALIALVLAAEAVPAILFPILFAS